MSGRILVVDDEPQTRRILRSVLAAKSYEVIEAECGQDAPKLIRSEKFDLILLEINMPGITGIEVCREAHTSSDIPIIIMSAGEQRVFDDYVGSYQLGSHFMITITQDSGHLFEQGTRQRKLRDFRGTERIIPSRIWTRG